MKIGKFIIAIAALLTLCVSCSKENEYDIYATITGKVLDYENAEPLENATVTLTPSSNNYTTTSDGTFKFTNLEAVRYTITVQKSGYATDRVSVNALAGETVEQIIKLRKAE